MLTIPRSLTIGMEGLRFGLIIVLVAAVSAADDLIDQAVQRLGSG